MFSSSGFTAQWSILVHDIRTCVPQWTCSDGIISVLAEFWHEVSPSPLYDDSGSLLYILMPCENTYSLNTEINTGCNVTEPVSICWLSCERVVRVCWRERESEHAASSRRPLPVRNESLQAHHRERNESMAKGYQHVLGEMAFYIVYDYLLTYSTVQTF